LTYIILTYLHKDYDKIKKYIGNANKFHNKPNN